MTSVVGSAMAFEKEAHKNPALTRHLPFVNVKPAFMAEVLGVEGRRVVPAACQNLGVTRLRRSSGSIIKARGTLLMRL